MVRFTLRSTQKLYPKTHWRLRRYSAYAAAIALVGGATAPFVTSFNTVAHAQTALFSDVAEGYWAEDYITPLAERGIISGFPDGSFRPNEPVTRAQFAALVRKAFPQNSTRNAISFGDVPTTYWAAPAIESAYTTGFLSGYPGNEFRPGQNIPRVQVLVSLANGLGYAPTASVTETLGIYQDQGAIPSYALDSVGAATEQQLVVNYPNVGQLRPNRVASRADVAAFIYQALAQTNQVATIASPYVAGGTGNVSTPVAQSRFVVPVGTQISVQYNNAEKILLAQDEPDPVPLSLTTTRNLQTQAGRVLIPAGSVVEGELRAQNGGAQFVADRIIANGVSYPVAATSNTVTEMETVRRGVNAGRVVRDAAIGAGAATILSGVLGDRTIEAKEVLGGAAAGAIAGVFLEKNSVDLIVIDPNTDLSLTVDSQFEVQ